MSSTFLIELGIPNLEVTDCTHNDKMGYVITVKNTLNGTTCYKCAQYIYTKDGFEPPLHIRHLPILGHQVILQIYPQRYECRKCNAITTQQVPWRLKKSPNTIYFEEHILSQLMNSTIEDVARREDTSYDIVRGIINRYISTSPNWDELTDISTVGIDEIKITKKRNDFIAIITAKTSKDSKDLKILGVLEDRLADTVADFLKTIPERLKKTVKTVCIDMHDGYIKAIKEVFDLKKVKIVIDRFHVAKNYRKAADELRSDEMKRLKKELSEEEYKELKGVEWAFRKKMIDLTETPLQKLFKLFSYSPKLKVAYDLMNELTAIFDQNLSRKEGEKKIKKWIKNVNDSPLSIFDTFISTLKKYWDYILNYFVNRDTSGFVEGFNNKIKVIVRYCYGIRNLDNLFKRIFISLEGERLFA